MSSLDYQPDTGAEPDDHWSTVYLSMRDASASIPINFITHPGVHLTEACFASGVYDDLPTQTCISDLFASQFRRLIIDLYWDNINQQFNLCPVELPPLTGNATAGYSVDSSALYSITASSDDTPSETTATPTAVSNRTDVPSPTFGKRQASASSLTPFSMPMANSTSSNATSTISNAPTSTTDEAIPTSTGMSGGTLLQLGPYMCSLDLNIGSIISLYNDYISHTSDTVSARLQYLDINLHAAAPFTNPSAPAHTPLPLRLPHGDDLIGAQFRSGLDGNLYTPKNLQDDRQDLNKSWFRDNYRVRTDTSYFSVTEATGDQTMSTPDGWPGESWILLTDSRRVLVSWGTIDPQMNQYDFQTDSSNIFNASDLMSTSPVQWNGNGGITAGCFYQEGATTAAATNASWAMAMIDSTSVEILPKLAKNMTACGISPTLNMTIGGTAAQNDLQPYRDFAQSSVYGWAPGEPANASSFKQNDDLRCAVLDSTSSYHGHWRVRECQTYLRAACRVGGEPYNWQLSSFTVPFGAAPEACPENTEFSLPRTGLENTYLYQQVLNWTSQDCDGSCRNVLSGIWINFNSLDQPNCWIVDGPNATCPYGDFAAEQQQRQVLIPTIAAIIILILTVLTILVKCNQNRRNRRSRRKGENGWDYEGIPS
jgi:hypothetical protein